GHAANLAQLFHEVRLRVQPPGRVGEYEIEVLRTGMLHRVEDDRARITALAAAHEIGSDALGPQTQLLGGRRAERVARGHHDRASLCDLTLPDFAAGRRLSHAFATK